MADIIPRNKVSPWQKRDLVSLVYSRDTWKNCFLLSMNIPYQYYTNDILTTSLELLHVLEKNYVTNFNPSVMYTYTTSDNTVTFLDLELTIENNHIKSYFHFKPTDSHNYLLFSSSHPSSCKHSITFSQMLRIKHCCSDNDDFITISNQVANHFYTRLYPKHIIKSANDNVQSIQRDIILMPTSKKVNMDHISLILQFHPINCNASF